MYIDYCIYITTQIVFAEFVFKILHITMSVKYILLQNAYELQDTCRPWNNFLSKYKASRSYWSLKKSKVVVHKNKSSFPILKHSRI